MNIINDFILAHFTFYQLMAFLILQLAGTLLSLLITIKGYQGFVQPNDRDLDFLVEWLKTLILWWPMNLGGNNKKVLYFSSMVRIPLFFFAVVLITIFILMCALLKFFLPEKNTA